MLKFAVIGFGARGQLYAKLFEKHKETELVAVCDPNADRFICAKQDFHLTDSQCYSDEKDFFSSGKIADLLIISSLDQNHYAHAIKAIELGYDILLEKPIATTIAECKNIYRKAVEKGIQVYICYVLRFAPFFYHTKILLDSGKFGKIANINLTENVGYWHQAHSFVRGNWRNSKESTPMIIAKCCHDLDILCWLMNDKALSVSSIGNNMFFNSDNAPEDCAKYCFECKYNHSCPYECSHFYKKYPWWLAQVGIYLGDWEDKDSIEKCLTDKNNPYSRCVFHCDNDVVDHQVLNISYTSGATATLTMTAFSNDTDRELHIHCTCGEIYGKMSENKLTYHIFGKEHDIINFDTKTDVEGHGGGDGVMIDNIVEVYSKNTKHLRNSIEGALQSHILGFAAEKSRQQKGKKISIETMS